jgi:hypothetical protein
MTWNVIRPTLCKKCGHCEIRTMLMGCCGEKPYKYCNVCNLACHLVPKYQCKFEKVAE